MEGVLFTLDALHCQKKTLEIVVGSDCDLLVQVKANQPTLLKTIEDLAKQTPAVGTHKHHQRGQRNRIESRQTSVWHLPEDHLGAEWSPLSCVIQVGRHTDVFNTTQGDWEPRSETAWYVCTRNLTATEAYHAVRNHWLIENSLHYVRDVAMGEDASRIRTSPGAFAQLRTLALNALREAGHKCIKGARQTIGWSESAMLLMFTKMQC